MQSRERVMRMGCCKLTHTEQSQSGQPRQQKALAYPQLKGPVVEVNGAVHQRPCVCATCPEVYPRLEGFGERGCR